MHQASTTKQVRPPHLFISEQVRLRSARRSPVSSETSESLTRETSRRRAAAASSGGSRGAAGLCQRVSSSAGGLSGFSRTTKAKRGRPTCASSPSLTPWRTSGRKYPNAAAPRLESIQHNNPVGHDETMTLWTVLHIKYLNPPFADCTITFSCPVT